MIKGKTKSGFKFCIDERAIKDFRITMYINHINDGTDAEKMSNIEKLITLILGVDGLNALIEHVAKSNDGFVPIDAITEEISDIFANSQTLKN